MLAMPMDEEGLLVVRLCSPDRKYTFLRSLQCHDQFQATKHGYEQVTSYEQLQGDLCVAPAALVVAALLAQ